MKTIFIKPPIFNTAMRVKYQAREYVIYNRKLPLFIGHRQGKTYRTFMKFDLTALPAAAVITQARLQCCVCRDEAPGQLKALELYQVLTKYSVKYAICRKSLLTGSPAAARIQTTANLNEFIAFEITPLVQNWHSGAAANLGLLLKMQEEGSNNLIAVSRKEHPDSLQWPYLEINYSTQDCGKPDGGCTAQTIDFREEVISADEWRHTAMFDILCFNYSYIVSNTGQHTAMAVLEQSADGRHWRSEGEVRRIPAGQSLVFIPAYIVKYARLCYRSELPGSAATLCIYLQGRVTGS